MIVLFALLKGWPLFTLEISNHSRSCQTHNTSSTCVVGNIGGGCRSLRNSHPTSLHLQLTMSAVYESRSATPTSALKGVRKLAQPVGIRPEHIAADETLLYLKPQYDQRSPNEYTIKRYWDDSTIFTITGHKYGDTPAREFRDTSGLPMFQSRATLLAWKRPLRVRLPGNETDDLVDFRCESGRVLRLSFWNSIPPHPEEKSDDNTVEVKVHDMGNAAWAGCSATVKGQKVLDIRESMTMNKTLPRVWAQADISLMPRQILEVLVAEGFDMSLVSAI